MIASSTRVPKFKLGRVVITRGCAARLDELGVWPGEFVARHASGDWGDIHPDDVGLNEQALEQGERLMSVYPLSDGGRVWVITEWDRSYTTLLLPEEY